MEKVKVAVIGCGYLGRWHVEKAISLGNAELIAIIENSQEGMKNAQKLYPNERVEIDLLNILDEIDAAIVATPTSTHYELVDKLITAGKHVFCEKPLTNSLEESLKLKSLKIPQELVLQVGHSERFHNVWGQVLNDEKLRPFFKETSIITIDRYAPFKGRATDVDVVSDLMIHDLDLLTYLFKIDVVGAFATGFKINTDKWDHVTAQLDLSSGSKAILTCGRNHVEERRTVQIINSRGTLLVDLMNLKYSFAAPGETSEAITFHSYEKADHLLEEQTWFYNCIQQKTNSMVPIEDGIKAVKWVDAVQRSLETGKAVVL